MPLRVRMTHMKSPQLIRTITGQVTITRDKMNIIDAKVATSHTGTSTQEMEKTIEEVVTHTRLGIPVEGAIPVINPTQINRQGFSP